MYLLEQQSFVHELWMDMSMSRATVQLLLWLWWAYFDTPVQGPVCPKTKHSQ